MKFLEIMDNKDGGEEAADISNKRVRFVVGDGNCGNNNNNQSDCNEVKCDYMIYVFF